MAGEVLQSCGSMADPPALVHLCALCEMLTCLCCWQGLVGIMKASMLPWQPVSRHELLA